MGIVILRACLLCVVHVFLGFRGDAFYAPLSPLLRDGCYVGEELHVLLSSFFAPAELCLSLVKSANFLFLALRLDSE